MGQAVDQRHHLLFLGQCVELRRIDKADLREAARFLALHRFAGQVLAGQHRAIVTLTQDGVLAARPGHRAANALRLPLCIAGLQATGVQCRSLLGRDFVVGHQDAAARPAIGGVEQVDRIERSAAACEEIDDQCAGAVADNGCDCIARGIERFGKREFSSFTKDRFEYVSAVGPGIVCTAMPDGFDLSLALLSVLNAYNIA